MVTLETSKLFGGMKPADVQELVASTEIRNYSHGDTIFKEGDQGDGMYMVRAGNVRISAVVNQNERKTLATLEPGEYFGEMAVIDHEPRSASATAEGDVSVYYMPSAAVLRILEKSPILSVRFIQEFSHRMREFNRHYVQEVLQSERLTLVGRFARSIVHDFKNPLNVIGLAAELAGMERSTPQMRQNASQRIRKQVDRLSNMINELLEFTRGSQNSIVPAQTNYRKFIEQILDELRPEVAEKKVEIVCDNEAPDLELLLDPHRLTHVFFNLIHNACDAMPEGGKVFLRFHLTPTELITEIEDTGKGFAPEIVNRLFEAFATHGKATGTGLGLSICKKIITDHRGHIEAVSNPDRGAMFSFGLPLAAAA